MTASRRFFENCWLPADSELGPTGIARVLAAEEAHLEDLDWLAGAMDNDDEEVF